MILNFKGVNYATKWPRFGCVQCLDAGLVSRNLGMRISFQVCVPTPHIHSHASRLQKAKATILQPHQISIPTPPTFKQARPPSFCGSLRVVLLLVWKGWVPWSWHITAMNQWGYDGSPISPASAASRASGGSRQHVLGVEHDKLSPTASSAKLSNIIQISSNAF